ncbi:MAG: endonuclease [Bacteroidota bacterium]|nr:endonuclease [Bacteroidota bacterium]
MPEGPSIVILKELVSQFAGKKITKVSGNTKVEKERLLNKKLLAFESWGKHFLILFKGMYVRIHFMLFGSYSINEEKEGRVPRLALKFTNGSLYFYACSVKIEDGEAGATYDWRSDVMSDAWDPAFVLEQLRADPGRMVCDVLMDQEIFSGVGNIIKNEVLFRIKVHPESLVSALPVSKQKRLIHEARKYSFQFYEWKKLFVLRKHYKIYKSKLCPRCNNKSELRPTGMGKRRSFICTNCQVLYK